MCRVTIGGESLSRRAASAKFSVSTTLLKTRMLRRVSTCASPRVFQIPKWRM
jgi:hypothetical protein